MHKTDQFLQKLSERNSSVPNGFPKKQMTHDFINRLSNFLFPACNKADTKRKNTRLEWESLKLDLKELLIPLKTYINNDETWLIDRYFNQIPGIYSDLLRDADTINQFDPASFSTEEIMLAYPGFQAIMTYRLAHPLFKFGVPILPRLMSEYAHEKTGIDIHPGATIGKSFFIDHGTGIVIGETTQIGNNVKIYQGVTLGALSVKKEEAKTKRHPTIEDDVIIYSGTTILGGKTVIGHDSIVGGNVWLTQSIDPFSMVHNVNEIKVRKNHNKKATPLLN